MKIVKNPKDLRKNKDFLRKIPDKPGYYQWWAPKSVVKELLGCFYEQVFPNMTKGKDELDGFYYIYVGIATKSLRNRLGWHIKQKNRLSAVKSGFLSTLRESISSLVSDQSDTEYTNKILDQMIVLYKVTDDFEKEETKEIESHCLPLNISKQHNKLLKECDDFTKCLKLARKTGKEKGIEKLRDNS